MAYLFGKDTLLQSLRLGFAGAWVYTHPTLSERLEGIQSCCPNLTSSFLVSGRPGLLEPTVNLAKTSKKKAKYYVSDYNHTDINVFGEISTGRKSDLNVEIPAPFAQTPGERIFFSCLQRAYRRTYNNANCTNRLCDIEQFSAVRFKTRYICTLGFFLILY
jgi:hypothetical protein